MSVDGIYYIWLRKSDGHQGGIWHIDDIDNPSMFSREKGENVSNLI